MRLDASHLRKLTKTDHLQAERAADREIESIIKHLSSLARNFMKVLIWIQDSKFWSFQKVFKELFETNLHNLQSVQMDKDKLDNNKN